MSDENILIAKEDNIRRFWISFTTWFMDELPGMGILQAYYEEYDNWNVVSKCLKTLATSDRRYKDVYRTCI